MGLAHGLFRRHVGRSPQHAAVPGHRDFPRFPLGQAEIGDVRLSGRVQHDIAGLEIPVHDARLVPWCTAWATVTISWAASRTDGREPLSRSRRFTPSM